MKILIWVHKDEAVTGKITEYHFQCPQVGYVNYVQVEITQDYFAQLEDKETNTNGIDCNYTASIDGPGNPINR